MLGEQGATDVLTVNALMVTMGPRRGGETINAPAAADQGWMGAARERPRTSCRLW